MTEPGHNPEEESRRRFVLALFIVHPSVDPDDITAALGLQPTIVHRFGAPRKTPVGRRLSGQYPDTRWRHSITYHTENQRFSEQLSAFLDKLRRNKSYFSYIHSTGGSIQVILQFLGDGYYGDVLSQKILAKMAELGVGFGIECFGVPQND